MKNEIKANETDLTTRFEQALQSREPDEPAVVDEPEARLISEPEVVKERKPKPVRNNPLRRPGAVLLFVLAIVSNVLLSANFHVALGLTLGGLIVLCGVLVLLSDNFLRYLDAQAPNPDSEHAPTEPPKFLPSGRTALRMIIWLIIIIGYLYYSFAMASWEYSWLIIAAGACVEEIFLALLDMRRA